jgi:regulatory protein
MIIGEIRKIAADRYLVQTDGEPVKTTANVIAEFRLYSGKELEEQNLEEFRLRSALALAREHALEIVSRRAMSVKELCRKLAEKGYEESVIRSCAEWLVENRFLDDADYARLLVRHYAGKGYGTGRIRSEFIRRGIAKDLWEEAFEELPENADEQLARAMQNRLRGDYSRENISKVSASFFRKGYSWDQIRSALRTFTDDPD